MSEWDHPGGSNLRDSMGLISLSSAAFSTQLTSAFRKTTTAINRFDDAVTTVVEYEYLKYHDRLPGGTSNPRLRKKRRTKVCTWYWSHRRRMI